MNSRGVVALEAYAKFKGIADEIVLAKGDAERRLNQYQACAIGAILLHLSGAGLLSNGLRGLNKIRIIRSSYLTIGAFLLQGFGHARLRWAQDRALKKTKELKKALRKEFKEVPEELPEHAARLFREFGYWTPLSLKYTKQFAPEDLTGLAKRCELVRAGRQRDRLYGKVAMGSAATGLAAVAGLLFWKKGLMTALPVALGSLAASTSGATYCHGAKGWRRLEEQRLKEAIHRGIKVLNGEGIDWEKVGAVVHKISVANKSDDEVALFVQKCPRLKALSMKGPGISGKVVAHLPATVQTLKLLGSNRLTEIPFDRLPTELKELALTHFPIGETKRLWKLRELRVERVTDEEMKTITTLPVLARLRIDNVDDLQNGQLLLELPPKLEKLAVPLLPPPPEVNPLQRCRYLTHVKMERWGGAIQGLSVLKRLTVRDGTNMPSDSLDWIINHHEIKKVTIGNFHKTLLAGQDVTRLNGQFLVYVNGMKDPPLPKERLGEVLRAAKVIFDARY